MNTDFAKRVTHCPSPSAVRRVIGSLWRQSGQSAVCPTSPRLDAKLALVTGGARGVGLATSHGLAARGAEVVMASRSDAVGEPVAAQLQAECGVPCHFVRLDLGDLRQIPRALDRVAARLAGRTLDVLVANAGLWPTRYGVSAQGHEIAFATNVLGHHALVRGALERGMLSSEARVLIVTGDIYVLSHACSHDYAYRGAIGGQLAYCRSKLGNLWYARELARRFPKLRVHAVHPGVVASQLGGVAGAFADRVKRALMLSIDEGAQTTLFCATQPGLPSSSYYHNVMGRVELDPADPGADASAAEALWSVLEELCLPPSALHAPTR